MKFKKIQKIRTIDFKIDDFDHLNRTSSTGGDVVHSSPDNFQVGQDKIDIYVLCFCCFVLFCFSINFGYIYRYVELETTFELACLLLKHMIDLIPNAIHSGFNYTLFSLNVSNTKILSWKSRESSQRRATQLLLN